MTRLHLSTLHPLDAVESGARALATIKPAMAPRCHSHVTTAGLRALRFLCRQSWIRDQLHTAGSVCHIFASNSAVSSAGKSLHWPPGLLPFLVSLLRANPRDEQIVLEAASVLKNFAFTSDSARSACANAGAATAAMYIAVAWFTGGPCSLTFFLVFEKH